MSGIRRDCNGGEVVGYATAFILNIDGGYVLLQVDGPGLLQGGEVNDMDAGLAVAGYKVGDVGGC